MFVLQKRVHIAQSNFQWQSSTSINILQEENQNGIL
jgi:hypothetical protein